MDEEDDEFESFDEDLDEPEPVKEAPRRQPAVKRVPRPEMEETIVRPMNTRQPARTMRPAGAPSPAPAAASRPQRPAAQPVRPAVDLEDDDDFEFLDIDDE